ncbi:zinc finger protein 135 [Melanotaenia boesemani]|uniref:zinc finger protein 135 n=1 Tax=Melanotaenia boesemani TaxID=1250792 RepID=UPI001C0544EF|nr:zinc finger protein 135 [Melanotaenia boesemani]
MESCSFQNQLLSVMEVLAKAAVAEINRRVDDSCAVLRMEVSQSRRDIDLLKSKCEVLEAELRRSRMRARSKVCINTPANEPFSTLVKRIIYKDSQRTDWGRPNGHQSLNQPHEGADMEPANEAEHIHIKEECSEEDMWRDAPEDKDMSGAEEPACFSATQTAQTDGFLESYSSAENPAIPESLVSPADGHVFPEQLHRNQNEAKLVVKNEKEEEPDEKASPLVSVHTLVTEEAEAQLWSTNLCRDAGDLNVSYAETQVEQIPAVYSSQTSLRLEDMAPRMHTAGKCNSALLSAARVKRRARTFAFKRQQTDEEHNPPSQINPIDSSFAPQQPQHQYSDAVPHLRNPDEDLTQSNSSVYLSSSFVLARRMRTPWRSGLGEKRFSCVYCNKSFMRFSQLKEHLRSHTGEKPFSCMQCGRSFTKQCNLIRHAVVHSGEKPYECSLCGKCFTQRSSLKSHQKTLH